MKILAVGGLSSDPLGPVSLDELYEYLQNILSEGTEVYATHMDMLVFDISPDRFAVYDAKNNLDVASMDKIMIRGPWIRLLSEYAYYLSRFCKVNGIDFWNDYSRYYVGTKFAQSTVFYEEKAPFLRTIFSLKRDALLGKAEQTFGFPYILKTNVGSYGDSNYLVKSAKQAQEIIRAEPDTPFIAQEYCPNDRDYRLLIMGGQHTIFERRGAVDMHINNTSKGGVAALTPEALRPELIEKAKEVSRTLGLSISGVDIMPRLGTDEYYFLEINSQPQFRTGAVLKEKERLLREFIEGEGAG